MNNLNEVKAFLENGTLPAVVEVLNPYANLNDGLYSCDDTIVAIVAGDKFGGVYKARSYQDALNVIDNMTQWLVENPFEVALENLKTGNYAALPTYAAQVWNPDLSYINRDHYMLSPVIVTDPDYVADEDDLMPRVFVNLPKIGSFYHWHNGTWLCNNRSVDNLHELIGWDQKYSGYTFDQVMEIVAYYQANA